MRTSASQLSEAERRALVGLVAVAAVASGIAPVDRYTWGLEVAIVVGVGALLAWLRPPVTRALAWLLATYALVMLVGAHYTYGEAPPGAWLAGWLGLERNPYDRVGHLFQGLVPASAVLVLGPRLGWSRLRLLALCAGLGTVALFEGLELCSAALAPAGSDFVQAQGDPHDTAWDVAFAAVGALLALGLPWRASAEGLAAGSASSGSLAPASKRPTGPLEGEPAGRLTQEGKS